MRHCSARALVVAALASCTAQRGVADEPTAPDAAASIDAPPPRGAGPVTLSDPANAAFLPAIAARAGRVVVAWHEFVGGSSQLLVTTIVDGTVGAARVIPETLTGPKHAAIAATTQGFVLAWDATGSAGMVVRTVDLDADGAPIGAPITISAAGHTGSTPSVTANGDDVAWAWTDGTSHYFARRGPVETVAASPVGTTLLAHSLLNVPRIAIGGGGALVIAYRDGGTDTSDWDVLAVARAGGHFSGPINISHSAGLLSDDISLAAEPDGSIDVVWVDQDPQDVQSFEVTHARRDAAGAVSAPARFATQSAWSWTPSVAPGMAAVWYAGPAIGGTLWLSTATTAPQQLVAGELGAMPALARDEHGDLHLAYVTATTPRRVRYVALP